MCIRAPPQPPCQEQPTQAAHPRELHLSSQKRVSHELLRLVLDVRLPDQSGLDLQRELAAAHREIPIIFITGHGDIPMSVQAMKGGAIEFLTKPFRDQELLDAIQLGLSRDRARRENQKALAALKERFESLSPREREIMVRSRAAALANKLPGMSGLPRAL
jgi:FixJ family two-component response regulator